MTVCMGPPWGGTGVINNCLLLQHGGDVGVCVMGCWGVCTGQVRERWGCGGNVDAQPAKGEGAETNVL